ncbi:MAG: hypothetical protein IT173_02180 [Acidobacteria bacterium]|nr:hypothetical protein [Acidobacteriota bacterium]
MGLLIQSFGAWGISSGIVVLALKVCGRPLLYTRADHVGGAGGTNALRTLGPIEIDDDNILLHFAGRPVKLEIENAFFGSGVSTVRFSIFSANQAEPVYTQTRHPRLYGSSFGGVKIMGSYKQRQISIRPPDLWRLPGFPMQPSEESWLDYANLLGIPRLDI